MDRATKYQEVRTATTLPYAAEAPGNEIILQLFVSFSLVHLKPCFEESLYRSLKEDA